ARETQAKVAAAKATSAEENLRIAEAQQALAEAQRSEINLKIARTELKAPAAGTISHRAARLGAVVSLAGEPLFRLVRNSEIEFDAEVPKTFPPEALPGKTVEFRRAGGGGPRGALVRVATPTVKKISR